MKNKSLCSRFFYASFALFLLGASQGLSASLSLADALDTTNVIWTTTDGHPWFAQTNVSHDGFDAAQVQTAWQGEYSSLETTVTGPLRLSFWWSCWWRWSVESQVRLFLDEQLLSSIGATGGWSHGVFNIGPGTHALRWCFEGYHQDSEGNMAWLDEVNIEPIDDSTGPPVVFWQPLDKTAAVGTTVIFTNMAGGSAPLSYQWQFEGTDIPQATNTFLVLRDVQSTNAGNYTVRVTNALGTALSSNLLLTVVAQSDFTDALDDPTLNWESGGAGLWPSWYVETETTHDGVDAAQGGDVEEYLESWLQTTVLGPGVINFWWKFEWRSEEGYMHFSIDSQSVWGIAEKEVDWEFHSFCVPPGLHTLRWTMSAGADDAFLDQVSFDPNGPYAPTITKAPPPHAAAQGDDVLLRVEVAGTEPFAYQWCFNGQSLPGANSATLMLTNVQPGQAGTYSVSVSNMVGAVVTEPVSVTVGPVLMNWEWARQMGGVSFDSGQCVAVDGAGYIYVGGYYSTNAILGSVLLTNAGDRDIFLAKFNSAGDVIWASRFGGPIWDRLDTIALDSSGNLYLCGPFTGTLRLETTNLVATGNRDLFLAKCDGDGNFLWARHITNSPTNFDLRTCLAVNSTNIYLAGVFQGTTTLGPYTFATTGYRDIFLAKYDSSGNVLWVRSAGTAAYNEAAPFSLAADSLGNAYLCGSFFGTLNFGTTNLTGGGYDSFLAKYDAQGNVDWVKQAQPTQGYYATLAVDPADNLIVHDSHLAKFSPSGQVLWVRAWPPYGGTYLLDRHPQVDAAGNIYVSGQLNGLFEYENHSLFSRYYNEIFVGKFDSEGHVVWLKEATTHSAVANDLAVSASGEIYLVGYFSTYDSSPDGGTNYFGTNGLVSMGKMDVFLAKLAHVPTLADALDTTNVTWTTTDGHPWFAQTNISHDGVDAAQLHVDNTGGYNSSLDATVTGPIRISFWWKSAGEWRQPRLALYLGDDLLTTNEVAGWTQYVFTLPPGTHTLRWLFGGSYDYEVAVGDMAWVDEVSIEPIDDTTGPPVIFWQPLNKTAVAGTTIFFNSFAGGSPPLYLQWLFEGNPIPDATNTLLVLRNVQLTNAGNYTLRVTNALGATVSSNAVLTVNATDALTEALDDPNLSWPSDGWITESSDTHDGIDSATGVVSCTGLSWLETTVIGPGSFSFWWKGHSRSCDGGYVSFSTDYGLVAGYSGDFDWEHHSFAVPPGIHTLRWEVYAGSECVGAQGWLDQVSFDPNGPYPPTIVKAPRDQAVSQGDDVLFSVEVDGCEPLAYQWYLNGQALPGETGARLLFTNVQPSYAGNYSVSISNLLQTITSQPAALSVGPMRLAWEWVQPAEASGRDYNRYVTVDNAGNIYVAGCFTNVLTLGTNVLTSSGRDDIFVAKYNSDGNVLQAYRMGGTNYDVPHSIAVDSGGNLYLSGILNVYLGQGDLFLAKYAPTGNLLWMQQPGKINFAYNEERSSIALDPAGNVYLAATFYGTVTLGSSSFGPPQYKAFFLAKFDGAGNVLWAKSPACPSSAAMYSLAADQFSNVYLSGRFTETIDFSVTNLVANEPSWYGNAFIAKYDSVGHIAWVQSPANAEWRIALGIDPANNLIMLGGFEGSITLGTNVLSHSDIGQPWGYLAKCDPSGKVLWARGMNRSGAEWDPQLTVDSTGSTYVVEPFFRYVAYDDYVLFDAGDGLAVIKIDSEGHVAWLRKVDPGFGGGMELAASAPDEVYVAGPNCLSKLASRSRPRLNAQLQTGTPGILFHLNSEIGRIYFIETSTDLHAWTPLVTVTNLTGEVQFTDTDPTPPTKRFYRAREQ